MNCARFALIALVPAMFNLSVASAQAGTMTVQICTGDGQVHAVQVPTGGSGRQGGEQGLCCAKGCHTGTSRKRGAAKI